MTIATRATAEQDGRHWGERETVGVEDAEDGVNVVAECVVEVEIGLGEGRRVPAEIGEDGLGRAGVVLDDEGLLDVHEFPYTDGANSDGAIGVMAGLEEAAGQKDLYQYELEYGVYSPEKRASEEGEGEAAEAGGIIGWDCMICVGRKAGIRKSSFCSTDASCIASLLYGNRASEGRTKDRTLVSTAEWMGTKK
ncbi:9777_t:CDS:2, partial [Acaulospora colombiana]